VERRLAVLAVETVPLGLTEPDPETGERWSAGQVWGHVAEFIPYWMGIVRLVVAEGSVDPVPFGRDSSDPGRLAGIERGKREQPARLMAEIREAMAELSELLQAIDEGGWTARGRHRTQGVMDVERIADQFLIGHLEGHATQLELLRESR
jgi:hypothetical protein